MNHRTRLTLLLLGFAALAVAFHAALTHWPVPQVLQWAFGWPALEPYGWVALTLTAGTFVAMAWFAAGWLWSPLASTLRALHSTVLSYRDGDYSVGIAASSLAQNDELLELQRLHGELGHALREQRQQLVQRELLLDTVVQHTPLALVLVGADQRVVYANLVARQLLARGQKLAGADWGVCLSRMPKPLAVALSQGGDQLLSVPARGWAYDPHVNENANLETGDELVHVSQRALHVVGQPHTLILLRRMTRELARQEVAVWKRVIRVLSHELNNSLSPISSLAHSAGELARRGDTGRVVEVLGRIEDRARQLHGFLAGYAQFAKLPQPQLASVPWQPWLEGLAAQWSYVLLGSLPDEPGRFDEVQMGQVLINLLRNAHEAGGPPHAVTVQVQAMPPLKQVRITVCDAGPGMPPAVLTQALLPFYSTKRSGTGLGLALAREIVEAHGGRITLCNRSLDEGGGLAVALSLPQP